MGFVVAEGCVRDTGEVITGNGKPVCDAPDWFVDWLVTDMKKLRALRRAERREKQQELNQRLAEREKDPTVDTAVIPKGYRTYFLKSRARWFITFGMKRERVYEELLWQCRENCEEGEAYASTQEGKQRIRSIAYDPQYQPGQARLPGLPNTAEDSGDGLVIKVPLNTSWDLLSKISQFPDRITAGDAYQRLGLDSKSRSDQHTMSRRMNESGFKVGKGQGSNRM